MKLMRNPVVVGILVVVAVVMVTVQLKPVWGPMVARMFPSRPGVAAPKPAAATAAKAPVNGGSVQVAAAVVPEVESEGLASMVPVGSVDRSRAWTESVRWVEAPRRDPFFGLSKAKQAKPGEAARDKLALQGVWRQTGRTVAVINQRTVVEGDMILQFRVETIEQDAVWVLGPNGREKLEFKVPPPKPAEEAQAEAGVEALVIDPGAGGAVGGGGSGLDRAGAMVPTATVVP